MMTKECTRILQQAFICLTSNNDTFSQPKRKQQRQRLFYCLVMSCRVFSFPVSVEVQFMFSMLSYLSINYYMGILYVYFSERFTQFFLHPTYYFLSYHNPLDKIILRNVTGVSFSLPKSILLFSRFVARFPLCVYFYVAIF